MNHTETPLEHAERAAYYRTLAMRCKEKGDWHGSHTYLRLANHRLKLEQEAKKRIEEEAEEELNDGMQQRIPFGDKPCA